MQQLAGFTPSSLHIGTDASIIAVIGLMIVYGIVASQMALARLAASIYVGLVLALYATPAVRDAIGSSSFGGVNATQSIIQLALLAAPVALLQLAHHHVHGRGRSSLVQVLIMALLTAFLIVAAVIMQLDAVTQNNILEGSLIASSIYEMRLAWIAGVPAAIVIFHFLHGKAENPRR